MIVYMDGVFDLFHRGHLEAIKKVRKIAGDDGKVIIGVCSDKDTESYKRTPIINEIDRVEIIKNIKDVDSVIFPCPMSVDENFLNKYKIDKVVHGFADEKDYNKQKIYFIDLIKLNKFEKITYYNKISTTEIIKKLKNY